MPVSYPEVREIALALPGVSEGCAYGGPSLHVGRKFLGRLREDGETFVLRIDPTERAQLLDSSPDVFFLTDHYRPCPYVLVNLLAVKPATLKPLIERGWRKVASKKAILAYDASVHS
jgi:hypothetical protein